MVIWEHPIDTDGQPIAAEDLKRRILEGWPGLGPRRLVPSHTCEVRRLLMADLYVLEAFRRFSEKEQVGIVFAGGALPPDDIGILREVWPALIHRDHPYSPRKIQQAAVVFVEGRHGIGSLRDSQNRLLTYPLEAVGRGLIFCPTCRQAEFLFKDVQMSHPSARFAVENVEQMILQRTSAPR